MNKEIIYITLGVTLLVLTFFILKNQTITGHAIHQNYSFELSSKQAYELINNKEVIILDIRTPKEHFSGSIPNSKNIDFYSNEFKYNIDKLDKEKIYLVYCNSGKRSKEAIDLMNKKEFKFVYNLNQGIISWKNKNLPII